MGKESICIRSSSAIAADFSYALVNSLRRHIEHTNELSFLRHCFVATLSQPPQGSPNNIST